MIHVTFLVHTHTYTHAHMHMYVHTHACTYRHKRTHICVHTDTHAHMYTHINSCAHTHTRTSVRMAALTLTSLLFVLYINRVLSSSCLRNFLFNLSLVLLVHSCLLAVSYYSGSLPKKTKAETSRATKHRGGSLQSWQ